WAGLLPRRTTFGIERLVLLPRLLPTAPALAPMVIMIDAGPAAGSTVAFLADANEVRKPQVSVVLSEAEREGPRLPGVIDRISVVVGRCVVPAELDFMGVFGQPRMRPINLCLYGVDLVACIYPA